MPDDTQKLWSESSAKIRYDLPREQERNKMSPLELAQLLSRYDAGTPPYILLEHELNMLLAKTQAKATLEAGRYGGNAAVLAAFLTAILGYLLGLSQSNELQKANGGPSTTCNCTYPVAPLAPAKTESQATKHTNGKVNPKP